MWTKEDYEFSLTIQQCANEGVRKAREAARNAGLPIAYSLYGRLFFQLADGTITEDRKLVDAIYDKIKKERGIKQDENK